MKYQHLFLVSLPLLAACASSESEDARDTYESLEREAQSELIGSVAPQPGAYDETELYFYDDCNLAGEVVDAAHEVLDVTANGYTFRTTPDLEVPPTPAYFDTTCTRSGLGFKCADDEQVIPLVLFGFDGTLTITNKSKHLWLNDHTMWEFAQGHVRCEGADCENPALIPIFGSTDCDSYAVRRFDAQP